ncbi:hypothetical protein LPJ61_000535 [Coemansia biformis]|uniref:Uncharacterized protein n=1 Tax=Coemansia biformis TaxID=1286918 RepID=A0A9W8D0F4_9FUNG|nr:hypothetical protein LPJ61_000535 [Coemansia biformis]
MDQSVTALPRMLWTTACSAWRWAATNHPAGPTARSSIPPQCPPQYPGLAYGFLQGTFGLPYGGYLVPPPRRLRSTLTLTDAAPMFSAVGTRRQIIECLRTMPSMAFCKMATGTCTSDLLIELYRAMPALSLVDEYCARRSAANGLLGRLALLAACCWRRLIGRLFSQERQLVIRSAQPSGPSDLKPLLRIRAPQGIMLSEIAALMDTVEDGAELDLTRDKAVNIRVMGRSRAASLLAADNGLLDDDNDDNPAFLLPPYQRYQADLPPAYSPRE